MFAGSSLDVRSAVILNTYLQDIAPTQAVHLKTGTEPEESGNDAG